jgi:RHS repeat-associated protein
VDKSGLERSFAYDPLGRVLSEKTPYTEKTFSYDSFNCLSQIDEEGNTTHYAYDTAGRKVQESVGDSSTNYVYNSLGQLYKKVTGDLVEVTFYDYLDRVIEERKEDGQGNWQQKVAYRYDEVGNIVAISKWIMGKESVEVLEYNPFRKIVKKIDALGFETKYLYEQTPHVETIVDPLGLQSIKTYHGKHLASLQTVSAQNKELSFTSYFYDANGNLEAEKTSFGKKTIETHREYDSMNRVISLIEAAGSTSQRKTAYTYFPSGLLESTTKPSGIALTNTYDALGNLVRESSSEGTVGYLYAYDKASRLIKARSKEGEITRAYNIQGNLQEETSPLGLTIKYIYDLEGRKKSFSFQEEEVLYDYEGFNLKKVSRHKNEKELYSHEYLLYDLSGRVLQEKLPLSAGELLRSYDPLGREIAIQSPYFTQKAFAFDPVGNLLVTERQKESLVYTYDELYQLTSEKDHTCVFDALYNRVEKDGEEFSTNPLNQIEELEYDLDGNLLFFNGKKLSYDALDRLILVESAKEQLQYSYDAFHRRIAKKVYRDGEIIEEVHFLYDGQNEIGSFDQTGTLLEFRTLGNAFNAEIGSSIALEVKGEVYAPIHDLQGNIAAVYSPKDRVLENYFYTAFGEEKFSSPLSPWRFSSKRTDEETGFVYYGRRYYIPKMGRWLTRAPLGLEEGHNQSSFF